MIKLYDLLVEMSLEKSKWTPIPSSELKKYDKEIFDLIQNAYAPIGGHPNYKSKDDVSSQDADYEVINLDSDPDIDAVSVEKGRSGMKKFVGMGHDGSSAAKSALINHKAQLLKHPGYYIEVSGKVKDILLAKGVKPITDEVIVRKMLKGKEITWHEDGSYDRMIGGEKHRKMMMGQIS